LKKKKWQRKNNNDNNNWKKTKWIMKKSNEKNEEKERQNQTKQKLKKLEGIERKKCTAICSFCPNWWFVVILYITSHRCDKQHERSRLAVETIKYEIEIQDKTKPRKNVQKKKEEEEEEEEEKIQPPKNPYNKNSSEENLPMVETERKKESFSWKDVGKISCEVNPMNFPLLHFSIHIYLFFHFWPIFLADVYFCCVSLLIVFVIACQLDCRNEIS